MYTMLVGKKLSVKTNFKNNTLLSSIEMLSFKSLFYSDKL